MDELQRLEELKQEAVKNPGKPKKGCASCKKKKNQVTEVVLPPVEEVYIPTLAEIRAAYVYISNSRGISEQDKPIINKVYESLFNEKFDYDCPSCVSKQAIKFYSYCKQNNIL